MPLITQLQRNDPVKKPFAYITAAWTGQEFTDTDQAVVYCRKVYQAGFTPICPILYLPHFLNDTIPAEHKDGIDMARDLLRRSHAEIYLIQKKLTGRGILNECRAYIL